MHIVTSGIPLGRVVVKHSTSVEQQNLHDILEAGQRRRRLIHHAIAAGDIDSVSDCLAARL